MRYKAAGLQHHPLEPKWLRMIMMMVMGIVMVRTNPQLLKARINRGRMTIYIFTIVILHTARNM